VKPAAPSVKPLVIGWAERVDLPDWGIRGLRAKVDTGARTSALHVENIEELPRDHVRFDVIVHRAHSDRRVHVKARVSRRGTVTSSNGQRSRRIFVKTTLVLGPLTRTIEVSLVDRKRMIHRMLLGRSALGGPILIDVNHRMAVSRRRRKKRKALRSKQ
jgi:hypothetical protein